MGYAHIKKKKSENVFNYKINSVPSEAISLSDALQLAEENGGKEVKKQCKIKCRINVFYSENYKAWGIAYKNDSEIIKRFYIDPKTGEIINSDRLDLIFLLKCLNIHV